MATLFVLNYRFRLSANKQFLFCKSVTLWMFPPLIIVLKFWIEHVSFRLLRAMLTFPTRIFCGGVPGFATDCPCGVWCRGLTTCLLCIGPLFGNLAKNHGGFMGFEVMENAFCWFHVFWCLTIFSFTLFSSLRWCFIFHMVLGSLISHRRSLETFFFYLRPMYCVPSLRLSVRLSVLLSVCPSRTTLPL